MDQTKLLMDYTIFHIGMYATLSTVLISFLGLEPFKTTASKVRWNLLITLLCFMVAGAFGGLVGSNLPHVKSFDEFMGANLEPVWLGQIYNLIGQRPSWAPRISATCCIGLEHAAFWVGIVSAFVATVRASANRST